MSQFLSTHENFNETRCFFYIATLCMWANLINLPKLQVKVKSPEVLLKTDYHSMNTKATSVADIITAIYGKDLELLKTG